MKPYNDGSGSTNLELEEKAKELNLNNFRGVFMRDELIKLKPLKHECGILNLNKSTESGSHWVCWYKNNNKYYFDSFGLIPPKEIVKYLKSPIMYSTFQIQTYSDSNCGEWCLYVLSRLNKNEDFIDIILSLINNKTY